MLELHSLVKLVKRRKRVGRGGERGGTSGKGGKGQTARSGGRPRIGFEGGQMPLYRRLPKRGFSNAAFATEVTCLNLRDLEKHFSSGEQITKDILIERGIIKRRKDEVVHGTFILKILGSGTLTKPFTVHADQFSSTAREAIVAVGGKAQLIKEI